MSPEKKPATVTVLTPPKTSKANAADWNSKAQRALSARTAAQSARKGMRSSFRRSVGAA